MIRDHTRCLSCQTIEGSLPSHWQLTVPHKIPVLGHHLVTQLGVVLIPICRLILEHITNLIRIYPHQGGVPNDAILSDQIMTAHSSGLDHISTPVTALMLRARADSLLRLVAKPIPFIQQIPRLLMCNNLIKDMSVQTLHVPTQINAQEPAHYKASQLISPPTITKSVLQCRAPAIIFMQLVTTNHNFTDSDLPNLICRTIHCLL